MTDPAILFASVLNGVTTGAVYALIALGQTLIYGVLHIINFAHGAALMVALYAVWWLKSRFGIDPYLALPIVVPAMFAFGYALQRGIVNRAGHGKDENILLVTLGIAIVLENLALLVFKSDTRTIETAYTLTTVAIGPAMIALAKLVAFAAGKPKKVAIVACMRKLLTILNAMLRDKKMWDATKHVQTPKTDTTACKAFKALKASVDTFYGETRTDRSKQYQSFRFFPTATASGAYRAEQERLLAKAFGSMKKVDAQSYLDEQMAKHGFDRRQFQKALERVKALNEQIDKLFKQLVEVVGRVKALGKDQDAKVLATLRAAFDKLTGQIAPLNQEIQDSGARRQVQARAQEPGARQPIGSGVQQGVRAEGRGRAEILRHLGRQSARGGGVRAGLRRLMPACKHSHKKPFGLSLSKPVLSELDEPFDKLRANGWFETIDRESA